MKKAIIAAGGKQYVVSEGQTLEIDLIEDPGKTVSFEPLLVVDGNDTKVGTPLVSGVTVTAKVEAADIHGDKVTAIRFKAKKRVKKVRGHRQHHTRVTITKIA